MIGKENEKVIKAAHMNGFVNILNECVTVIDEPKMIIPIMNMSSDEYADFEKFVQSPAFDVIVEIGEAIKD